MNEVPNSYPSLFAAYLVVWTVLCVYALSLGFRISKLEKKTKERDENS